MAFILPLEGDLDGKVFLYGINFQTNEVAVVLPSYYMGLDYLV